MAKHAPSPLLKVTRSNSTQVLAELGFGHGQVAGYVVERGVNEALLAQARELAAGTPAELAALLDGDALFDTAISRAGVSRAELLPRTLEQCSRDEAHPLRVRLPEEAARRQWERAEERRVLQLARVLEEKQVAGLMAKQDAEAASRRSGLHEELEHAVKAEEARISGIQKRAAAKQGVLDAQNRRLVSRRQRLQDRAELVQAQALMVKERKAEALKARRFKLEQDGMVRKARREEQQRASEEQRHLDADAKKAAFDARIAARMAAKRDAKEGKNARLHERARARQAIIEQHKAAREAKRRALQEMLEGHDAVIQQQVDARNHERRLRALEARAQRMEKVANVERSRRKHAFKQGQTRRAVAQENEEWAQRQQLRRALERVRQHAASRELVRQHQRKAADLETERHVTPGPGQYHVPSSLKGGFGFSNYSPKGYIELQQAIARQLPAPGQRQDIDYTLPETGAFNTAAKPKSDIEWSMLRAAELPAPGERQKTELQLQAGGAFSTAKPKSDIDWAMQRAAELPGAGEYNVPDNPAFAPPAKSIAELREKFRSKVLKKTAFEMAAEGFAGENKGLLSKLRKTRFQNLGRKMSQEFDAKEMAAAAAAAQE
eukprot:g2920.t1